MPPQCRKLFQVCSFWPKTWARVWRRSLWKVRIYLNMKWYNIFINSIFSVYRIFLVQCMVKYVHKVFLTNVFISWINNTIHLMKEIDPSIVCYKNKPLLSKAASKKCVSWLQRSDDIPTGIFCGKNTLFYYSYNSFLHKGLSVSRHLWNGILTGENQLL